MSKTRMEAFSDGVVAIITTVMMPGDGGWARFDCAAEFNNLEARLVPIRRGFAALAVR